MPGAVFVDETGRRDRRVGSWFRVLGLLPLLYVVLLAAALVRAPWVPHISLPGLGAVVPHTSAPPPDLGDGQLSTPLPVTQSSTTGAGDSGTGGSPSTSGGNATSTAAVSVPPTTSPTRPAPSSTTPTTKPGNGNGPPSSVPGPGTTNPRKP